MLISGIIASIGFSVIGLVYLFKLISLDYGREVGWITASLIIVFPASYFFLRPGPESLFLFLAVTSFYFARKKRWLLTGFLAGLAALTRLQGVLLLLPLVYIYYRQYKLSNQNDWRVLSLLVIPLAQIGFMLHLYFLTGNLFASMHMQGVWDNALTVPFSALAQFLAKPVLISYYGWDLTLMSFLVAVGTVILTLAMFKYYSLPVEYQLYSALSVFLIISRGNLNGTLRFLLLVFPIFLCVSLMIRDRKFATNLVLYSLSVLQAFYFLSFIHLYNWAAT
jgi:Gpi18-like mannosyltransferase